VFALKRSRRPEMTRTRRLALATALTIGVSGFGLLGTSPAEAAARIDGPAGFSCDSRLVRVSPPRVWASYGTEQVLWKSVIERWDSYNKRWYQYAVYDSWSSFNYFGQSVTSWSGGRYVNSRMNLPVYHPGYYRVGAIVAGNQGGVTYSNYVAGGGWCYMG